MKKIFLLLLIVAIAACKQKTETPKTDKELDELFALMQGSFNSEAQAKADSTYYNISLHMYPIWEDKGNYLYVEQALNSMQNKPYRQRIYEVTRDTDSTFKSAIYTLKTDSLWIGKWKTPKVFDSITPQDIALKQGCEVILKRLGNKHFKGSTIFKSCESSLRGASFATSEVEITSERVLSWDRGFDSLGNHVWGATKGAYVFDKLN